MNHGSPRPILALLALALAVPGASAQSLHYTDPSGDVQAESSVPFGPAAPFVGPVADVVDLTETTFVVANGTLAVTFHLVDLSNVDTLSVEQISYYATFAVTNGTSESNVGVEALRYYLATGGVADFPAPWEFRFQANPLEHAGPSINGTVDIARDSITVSFPLELTGFKAPTRIAPVMSGAEVSSNLPGYWLDSSLASGSTLNLSVPAAEPEPEVSSTTTREAIGVPLLACLAALALAARSRR